MVAVVNREQAVGVSLLNCQKHRSSPVLQLHTTEGLLRQTAKGEVNDLNSATSCAARSSNPPYEIEMISTSWPGRPTTSPTALPVKSRATGDTKEIEPALGSASSSPTMRYFCIRPSSRLKVTVLPNATVSVDLGSAIT